MKTFPTRTNPVAVVITSPVNMLRTVPTSLTPSAVDEPAEILAMGSHLEMGGLVCTTIGVVWLARLAAN